MRHLRHPPKPSAPEPEASEIRRKRHSAMCAVRGRRRTVAKLVTEFDAVDQAVQQIVGRLRNGGDVREARFVEALFAGMRQRFQAVAGQPVVGTIDKLRARLVIARAFLGRYTTPAGEKVQQSGDDGEGATTSWAATLEAAP